MLKEIVLVAIILLSVPIGYLIAYLCRDELVVGRKWFRAIAIVSILLLIYFAIIDNYAISLTLLFISVVSIISLWKSHDKKLTRKRIN